MIIRSEVRMRECRMKFLKEEEHLGENFFFLYSLDKEGFVCKENFLTSAFWTKKKKRRMDSGSMFINIMIVIRIFSKRGRDFDARRRSSKVFHRR